MRYFIIFAYNGKNYHGWQVQPNAITVQQVLEEKLSILLGKKTEVTGAGRTDAGVHARSMTAHFDCENISQSSSQLIHRLNSFLPKDISVQDIFPVTEQAHARFDATSRSYEYIITTRKNPFLTEYAWEISHLSLNVERMNAAAALLLHHEDFTSFARLHADNKTNICHVQQAYFEPRGAQIYFSITADRFLRNMVRAITGTLVDVGSGKLSEKEFEEIIRKKGRNFASASAPAHGLYLTAVRYPEHIRL